MADVAENPYIAVANRKARNLKKKLQNIQKVEVQLESGKSLNEEQLVLLSTKPAIERAILDIDAIKVQLEDVAKEVAAMEVQKAAATAVEAPVVVEEVVAVEEEVVVLEVATETQPVEQVAISTQCEAAATATTYDAELVQNMLQGQVRKLLKTLHVCSRYHSITGTNLPPDVDYFGKCLLGMTSIGDFYDALAQSVKNATMFLDPVAGLEHEAIRGMNFVELGELIDQLAGHIDGRAGNGSMESFLSSLASPVAQPEINFFGTEEIADQPTADEVVVEVVAVETTTTTVDVTTIENTSEQQITSAATTTTTTAAATTVKRERKPRERKPRDTKVSSSGADGNSEVSAASHAQAPTANSARKERAPRSAEDKPRERTRKPTAPAVASSNENVNSGSANDAKVERAPRENKGTVRRGKDKAPATTAAPTDATPTTAAPTDATPTDSTPTTPAPVKAPVKAPVSWASAVDPSAAPTPVAPTRAPTTRPSTSGKPSGVRPVDRRQVSKPNNTAGTTNSTRPATSTRPPARSKPATAAPAVNKAQPVK